MITLKKNEVIKKIEEIAKDIKKKIESGQNPYLEIPVRRLSNISFDEDVGRITLGASTMKRYFFNLAHIRKFTQNIEVLKIAKELIEVDKHLSLRETFYKMKRTIPNTKINIVDDQRESDTAIEEIELMTGFLREQLHINANRSGMVAGNVVIKDKGDTIDWSKLGSGGWSVPSNVEDIEFKKVDAKFIIYVEKAAEWERLHEDRVWKKLNCIIVASQGQAPRGVRRLLQRLNMEYGLPVYVLTDLDPWGFYIYSVLKYGSIKLAHISKKLAIPGAKFLGLMPKDVEKYGLKKHLIKFEEVDKKRLKEIKEYPWFKKHKGWQKLFKELEKLNGKAELAALTSQGISFISEKYIPEKIKNQDWLE